MDKGLFQKEVAAIFGVTEDCVTYWENGRYKPQIRYYPAIISFLGYYPFSHETETLAGKLRQIRYAHGYDFQRFADMLKVSPDAAKRWESGKPIMNPKLRMVIQTAWEELQVYQQEQCLIPLG